MSLFKERLELEIEEAELLAQKKLSSYPAIVRWALILIVVAAIPAYFVAKNLSLKYWTAKYNQYVLTAKPSFTDPKPPKVSNITLFTQSSSTYAALVTVANENLDLSLSETPYRINFYNNTNTIVYTAPGKMFLLPNQKKDVVVPKFIVTDAITSAQIVLSPDLQWQKRVNTPKVFLLASQPVFYTQPDPLAFAVEGNVYNNSPYALKQIHLTFKVLDINGAAITVSQRDEFALKPYERRAYKQLWPGLFASNAAKVEVAADTNVLDPDNLTAPNQQSTSASDLNRP